MIHIKVKINEEFKKEVRESDKNLDSHEFIHNALVGSKAYIDSDIVYNIDNLKDGFVDLYLPGGDSNTTEVELDAEIESVKSK